MQPPNLAPEQGALPPSDDDEKPQWSARKGGDFFRKNWSFLGMYVIIPTEVIMDVQILLAAER